MYLPFINKMRPNSKLIIIEVFQLKPWHIKEWVIAGATAEFVCGMEEVLDVYEGPYEL